MSYKFTIIIPVYNEEDNLPRLEKALLHYINIAILPTKIVFVNDGSTDNSQSLIENICDRHGAFFFITFNDNRGLSAALKVGFDHTKTDLVGYIDSDLQTTPNDFNRLLDYSKDYDMVTGIRINRQDKIIKRWSSKIANSIRRGFTKDGIIDTGCPLKIMKTSYAKRIPMFNGLHRFLPAMVLLQKGKIKQVPVQHFPRLAGKTKFGFWNRSFSPLIDCFIYLWMKKKYINYDLKKQNL